MHRRFLLASALAAFVAVGMGAFGAHGLSHRLGEHMMSVYQTAVHYQIYHALGLGIIGLLARQYPQSKRLFLAGWLMLGGIAVFSGSLYLLSIGGFRWLGMITPIGGLALLAAWFLLAVFAYQEAD